MMLVSVANTPDIIKGPVNLEAETAIVATTTEQKIDITNATSSVHIKAITKEYFKDTPLLAEIARCESEYRQFVNGKPLRGVVNSADIGVMQINEKYHLSRSKQLGMDIYTLEGNLKYGAHLYKEQGGQPWSASRPCWGAKADQTLAVNK